MRDNVPGMLPSTPRGEKRPPYYGSLRFQPKPANRCSCGYRIRGENHKDGPHHNKVSLRK